MTARAAVLQATLIGFLLGLLFGYATPIAGTSIKAWGAKRALTHLQAQLRGATP